MAPVAGRRAARAAPEAAAEQGDSPRSPGPEELEAEAAAEVRGYETVMQARAEAAFPDRTDPIRVYGEGMAAGGVAFVRSVAKLTTAADLRLRNLLGTAQRTAQAQVEAATAQAEADRAAAKLEAVAAVRAGLGEVIAADRRARYGWAAGIAGLGIAAAFGLGMLTQHWRARATEVDSAVSNLAELRQEASLVAVTLDAERVQIGNAATGLKQAVADAGAGLSVLRTLGTLPEGERTAMNGILDALAGAANGKSPSPQLRAVRELMALRPVDRAQAIEFARIGDFKFRSAFLPVIRLAEDRSRTLWWEGERVYPGCLTNGPTLATQGDGRIATCLVQLPDAWPPVTDTYLRTRHYGLPAN